MPDLAGMEYEEAKSLVEAQNLLLKKDGVTEEYNDFVEKGRVVSQNIDPEERIAVQTEITLIVSLGSLSEETAVLTVPDLAGLTKEGALEKLAQLKEETGFTYSLGKVKKEHSTEVEKGKIISQGLEPGKKVRTNEPITLVISKGPQMVQVPDLLYKTKEEAVKLLEEAGLKAEVQEEYSSKVSKGLVVSQRQEGNSKAGKGTVITIVVSLGEAPQQTKQPTRAPQQTQAPQAPQAPQPTQVPQAPQPTQAPPPDPQPGGGVIEDDGGGVIEDDGGGVIED